MHSALFFVAPLVAMVSAASSVGTTTVSALSGDKTIVSTYTYTYSNPATAFLTETNSKGVVTGKPGRAPTQPSLVTSQPTLQTIPAGLPTGVTVIPIVKGTKLSSFTVSVGKHTTVVLNGGGATLSSGAAGENPNPTSGGGEGGSGSGSGSGGKSGKGSSSTSGNAAPTMMAVSGGVIGLGAVVAALL